LAKALALEPADRYKDVGYFLAALKQAMPAAGRSIRTSAIPQVQDAALDDDGVYGRTFIRDSQPTPNESLGPEPDLAGQDPAQSAEVSLTPEFPWETSRRKKATRAVVAIALLIAAIAAYFTIQRFKPPPHTTQPMATRDQPAPERKSEPVAPADSPSPRDSTATRDQAGPGKSPTVADDSRSPGASIAARDSAPPANSPPEVAPKGSTDGSSAVPSAEVGDKGAGPGQQPRAEPVDPSKRRTHAVRKAPQRPRIELE
jgi:hypothetical protein